MQAVEDKNPGHVSRPANGNVIRPAKPKRVRRFRKMQSPRRLDSRVAIGLAFQRWRSLKKTSGLDSDADVALYLLNAMDQHSTASDSSQPNNQKIKISHSEVQTLIEQEVQKELMNHEAKMKGLIESLQLMNNDVNFEKSVHELETQLNTVSRKAEAAFAYVAKIQQQSLPSSPDHENSGGETFEEDSTETLPQGSEQELEKECVIKTSDIVKMLKTTTTDLKDIRADNEELAAEIADLHREEPQPVFASNGFCMERNELKHLSSDKEASPSVMRDLSEQKPPLLSAFGSSKETVCLKAIKREFPNAQEENNDRNLYLPMEPKIKKFKEDCDYPGHSIHSSDQQEVLICPALPTTPFPGVLPMDAALYSMPPKVVLKLALIRNPTKLSVLWNVMETDPAAPPMDSYTILLTMEKVKGSGIFPKWTSYNQLKAKSLPMCALIKKYKPGHKVCAAVIGKDIFGRYGPYSEVVTKTMPE